MEFVIKNINKSINNLMRAIGYHPTYLQLDILRRSQNEGSKISIMRQVGRNDYPRFHLYIKQNGQDFIFNLHLDQKKPSYKGSTGHSGEYDGKVVEDEAERIKNILIS